MNATHAIAGHTAQMTKGYGPEQALRPISEIEREANRIGNVHERMSSCLSELESRLQLILSPAKLTDTAAVPEEVCRSSFAGCLRTHAAAAECIEVRLAALLNSLCV